jgi:hypothetical protein
VSAALGLGGQILTEEEQRVIRVLKRLEKDWPRGLSLNSMAGSLELMREPSYSDELGAMDREQTIWSTLKIKNTGGDW